MVTDRLAAAGDEAIAASEDPVALCRRVAQALPGRPRRLVAAVGEHLTTIVCAVGDQPVVLWTVPHGQLLEATFVDNGDRLVGRLRASATVALAASRIGVMRLLRCELVAASRLARAVVTLGAEGGRAATPRELAAALQTLASTWEEQCTRGASPAWLRTTLVGAAMVEGIVRSLGGGRIVTMPEAPPFQVAATPRPALVGHSTS
jgi:hypothetical protein